MSNSLQEFDFQPQPEAAAWVAERLDDFLGRCAPAKALAQRMLQDTGTRFQDWVERIVLPCNELSRERTLTQLNGLGFAPYVSDNGADTSAPQLLAHAGGMFPVIELGTCFAVSLRVDSVGDFCEKNDTVAGIEGDEYAPTRRVLVCACGEVDARMQLWATERHHGRFVTDFKQPAPDAVRHVLEALSNRKRDHADPEQGFARARQLIEEGHRLVGEDYTSDLFFLAERRYWESRNEAARVQKARQDALGLGWGNQDHHTYRSSREYFKSLISCLELLGLRCRERFYAGKEAGWGAQVLEHPRSGVMVFADVDLEADEVMGDFAHDGLAAHDQLGTVGLWCKLHGEAFLEAGIHHLEAQFDFAAACAQLENVVGVMPPFTDFSYLKQCFTHGQVWPVPALRLQKALDSGWITPQQAATFQLDGALGSHLEILERNSGYKGFNQTGISEIIARTDPRAAAAG